MSEPLVCAVMLTKDRPAMAKRAIEAFRAQTYKKARLVGVDTTIVASFPKPNRELDPDIGVFHYPGMRGSTIGALRNKVPSVLAQSENPPDIYIHWDDDDWSHPNRIEEQVALLQSSGADVVGYREMLFWRSGPAAASVTGQIASVPRNSGAPEEPGEAWLFRSCSAKPYALGTSLCYWRKTWERKPFPKRVQPHNPSVNWGEDTAWIKGLNLVEGDSYGAIENREVIMHPPMIASIHGGNTSPAYRELSALEWLRVPQWDAYCAERMKL